MKYNRLYEDKELFDNCIIKHFFRRTLENTSRIEIIKEILFTIIPANTIIFQQGTSGKFFYILKVDITELFIEGKKIKTFSVWELFRELSLLHWALYSDTDKAIT